MSASSFGPAVVSEAVGVGHGRLGRGWLSRGRRHSRRVVKSIWARDDREGLIVHHEAGGGEATVSMGHQYVVITLVNENPAPGIPLNAVVVHV